MSKKRTVNDISKKDISKIVSQDAQLIKEKKIKRPSIELQLMFQEYYGNPTGNILCHNKDYTSSELCIIKDSVKKINSYTYDELELMKHSFRITYSVVKPPDIIYPKCCCIQCGIKCRCEQYPRI